MEIMIIALFFLIALFFAFLAWDKSLRRTMLYGAASTLSAAGGLLLVLVHSGVAIMVP